ncbi:unnamed protein product [Hermetia illucens]|uniref:MADF domain-containing protein n=1 Tax=Hermetia illucens TaxID=343691 RepID=A0A7R8UMU8_HERIL|nr:unnamed protein product [Hermetia illucens]
MKKLSVDEKEKFIKILKENSAVWDLSEAGHRKSTVLAAAWEKISKEMKRPVAECKTIYRSFKDLARYRGRKKQCQKSGSELIQDESESPETSIGNEEDCAEFSVCLDFLQPNSSKRRTFSTSTIATEEDVSSPASDGSQYNFLRTPQLPTLWARGAFGLSFEWRSHVWREETPTGRGLNGEVAEPGAQATQTRLYQSRTSQNDIAVLIIT